MREKNGGHETEEKGHIPPEYGELVDTEQYEKTHTLHI